MAINLQQKAALKRTAAKRRTNSYPQGPANNSTKLEGSKYRNSCRKSTAPQHSASPGARSTAGY